MVRIEGGTVFVDKADTIGDIALNNCRVVLQMDKAGFSSETAKAFLDERVRGRVIMDDVEVLCTDGYAKSTMREGKGGGVSHTLIKAKSREDAARQLVERLRAEGHDDVNYEDILAKMPNSVPSENAPPPLWQRIKQFARLCFG